MNSLVASNFGPGRGASSGVGAAKLRAPRDDLETWYESGQVLPYDPTLCAIGSGEGALRVFVRREGDTSHAVSFLSGFPDGSSGWANVPPHLPGASAMPKLFVEFGGMGDSDKPKDYTYSTAERTDLVEAIWRDLSIQSTTLVAFDFSSLVVLEHLRPRLERSEQRKSAGGPNIRGVFIFNGGLFADGHSHPWYITPVLRRLPRRAADAPSPFTLFKMKTRVMWSKGNSVTDADVRRVYNAINRHDGAFYLAAAAGFVADHKAQGERLDFGRLCMAWRERFPFLVSGAKDDAFEHRQVDLAEERLARFGLRIARLPGGHMTTHEEPRALAELITRFEQTDALQPAR
jgi:pimeloyl-ACP methyl ester carboxylesterase